MRQFVSIIFQFQIYLSIVMACGTTTSVKAQRLEYEVIKGDKNVGHMIAEKIVKGDTVIYAIESVTAIKLLLTFTVHYELEEMYVGGKLISGTAESKLNGSSRTKSRVWLENGEYIVEVNGYEESMDTDFINYSVPELYFSEPGKRGQTFSQQFAQQLVILQDEPHVFTLYSEDGKNTHIYENGLCVHVKLNRTYASFDFQLKR